MKQAGNQPPLPLDEAIAGAKAKLDEARFFLGEMAKTEQWSHENLSDAERHFKYYLSGFLSAARSGPQILSEAVDWPQINAIMTGWAADDRELERSLSTLRNLVVHRAQDVAGSTKEYVPVSELPRRPAHPYDPPRSFFHRMPGVPEVRRVVRHFFVEVGGQDRPAVECSRDYLGLMGRLVSWVEKSKGPVAPASS